MLTLHTVAHVNIESAGSYSNELVEEYEGHGGGAGGSKEEEQEDERSRIGGRVVGHACGVVRGHVGGLHLGAGGPSNSHLVPSGTSAQKWRSRKVSAQKWRQQ